MAKTTPATAQQKTGSAKKTAPKKASSAKPAKLGGVPTQGQIKRT